MPSYRDRVKAKYEAGVKPRPKVASPTNNVSKPINEPAKIEQPKMSTDERKVVTPEPRQEKTYKDESLGAIKQYLADTKAGYEQDVTDTKAIYEQKKQADLSALRNAIAKKVSGYQQDIGQSRDIYQPMREQADVRQAQNLRALRETQAAQGVFGGANITGQTGIRTQTGADIGALNQQEAQYRAGLQNAIRDAQASGSEQELQIGNQAQADRLQALMGLRQGYRGDAAQGNQQLINQLGRAEDIQRQDERYAQQARSSYLGQMGVADPYGGQMLSPEQLGGVSQYSDDYAAALQDPNLDPQTRALIEQARFEKVTGDPNMMEQYGEQYMTLNERQQQEALRQREAEAIMQAQQEQQMMQMEEAQRQEDTLYDRSIEAREQAREDRKTDYAVNKPYFNPKTSGTDAEEGKSSYSKSEAENILTKAPSIMTGTDEYGSTTVSRDAQKDILIKMVENGQIDEATFNYLNAKYELIK